MEVLPSLKEWMGNNMDLTLPVLRLPPSSSPSFLSPPSGDDEYISVMDPKRPETPKTTLRAASQEVKDTLKAAQNPKKLVGALAQETINPLNYLPAGIAVGKSSKLWDNVNFLKAIRDKVRGASSDEIWYNYRTMLDAPDFMPRQEIPSVDMKLKTKDKEFTELAPLNELVDFPSFDAAYPGVLKKLDASLSSKKDLKRQGLFDNPTKSIGAFGANPEEVLYTLAHELDHVAQRIEGFAAGGNPAMYKDLSKLPQGSNLVKVYKDIVRTSGGLSQEEIDYAAYRRLLGEISARASSQRSTVSPQFLKAYPLEESFKDAAPKYPENVGIYFGPRF